LFAEILQNLCAVLLSEMGVSVEVLTEAIIAVAEVVRGNQKNQDYLASMSLVNPHDPQPRYDRAHCYCEHTSALSKVSRNF
jgi:hypothetical protein